VIHHEWNVEQDGPMSQAAAVEELLEFYQTDDEYSPYLFVERRKNVLRIRCKDGTELVVRVDVRR
jgi:hypothetical protein